MLNTLTKKRGKKGFTLMELLIVVAIIAILVAISIPVFSSQLDKAREATDQANERAAKAAAVVQYLTADTTPTASTTYCYDAAAGTLSEKATQDKTEAYGKTSEHEGSHIEVTITKEGQTTIDWQ